ncbi:hypothetical protein FIBSPDRAFT_963143 [Athelia psychrophila]|uniref:Uncharacterized protein n=1 Tax=Athelia psychrophila TaxID=1759441 RepID=A0A165ZC95_9AGAM|nr:hypothetical protein FIBSPDRAFT_963143 [Fibularhizoctonia sp. CBS 109695]
MTCDAVTDSKSDSIESTLLTGIMHNCLPTGDVLLQTTALNFPFPATQRYCTEALYEGPMDDGKDDLFVKPIQRINLLTGPHTEPVTIEDCSAGSTIGLVQL